MNQFFAGLNDPILNDPACEGIAEWLKLSPGMKKAEQGAELYDRLLLLCASDTGQRRYAALKRTVWAFTHLSKLLVSSVARYEVRHGRLPSPESVQRWLAYVRDRIFEVNPAVPITSLFRSR